MKYAEIRQKCLTANIALVANGLVDLTFGNVSVLSADGNVFAIKPSGVPYDTLAAEHMVVLDLEGNIIDGELRPSSDTPTHRRLYQEFASAGICSVAHTHSKSAVAFAQAGKPIPCLGTTHADFFCGPVPVTRTMTSEEVNGDYEWETGEVITEAIKESGGPIHAPGVLVRSHGPFCWGTSETLAVEHSLALEVIADMALKTLSLDPHAAPVPDYLLSKHFSRKHGASAYYGQS